MLLLDYEYEKFMSRDRNPIDVWWKVNYENAVRFSKAMSEIGLSLEELLTEVLGLIGSPDETLNLEYRFLPQLTHLAKGYDLEFADYIAEFDEGKLYPFESVSSKCPTIQLDVTNQEFFSNLLPKAVAALKRKQH